MTTNNEGKTDTRLGQKPKYKILYSLLIVLVFIGLAPLATVAWKLVDINKEALKTFQQQSQLLLASSIAHHIDSIIQGNKAKVRFISDSIGSSIEEKGLRRFSASQVKKEMSHFLSEDLKMISYNHHSGRLIEVSTSELYEGDEVIDNARQISINRMVGTGNETGLSDVLISDPILPDFSRKMMFLFSCPVQISGRKAGIVSTLVSLDEAWQQVFRESEKMGYTVFALDLKGNLLARSEESQLFRKVNISDFGIVRNYLESKGRIKETSSYSINVDGKVERYLGSYEVTKNGWGIFIQVEEWKAYYPIREIITSTSTWALGVIILAVIIAVIFAGRISQPINMLASSSQKFAGGNFSARVPVKTKNEIGQLAATFNYMAEELQNYIERLKKALNENNQLFLGTIRVMATAIDEKDPYTRGHSVRVNKYAVIIAKYMGLSEEEIKDIHVSSLLHDVGKIVIDDAILKKPSPLTDEEYALMKQHAEKGANIMSHIKQMEKIIPGMRYHHEKKGGGGYPDDLKGEEIPLSARIIHVADTFDAMTTDRPYQKGMSFEQALKRLNEMKGWDCDEGVVEAFNRAYRNDEFKPEETAQEASSLK
jgi:HD-GYP domain-containing protein (c-di-GMP phosphodiesterase class II)